MAIGLPARFTVIPIFARSDCTRCASTAKLRPFELKSVGYSRLSVGLAMPEAATSAFALVRSVVLPEPGLSAPRNIDGTTPAAWTAPEPASETRPS